MNEYPQQRAPAARSAPITVLTSGVGLGVYVPALLNQRDLIRQGHEADVEVIEGWYTEAQLARHLAHRDAFRENFKLALLANRMPRNVQEEGFDFGRMDALLERWAREGRSQFLVWSGFWFPVLERYLAQAPHLELEVDLCRIDAIESASFRIQRPLPRAQCREIWLWNWAERRLEWQISVAREPPVQWESRDQRLVIHGGGWAIGTYNQVLPELAASGYALDVLAPGAADWSGRGPLDRHFAPDASWHPWQRDADSRLSYPPLSEVAPDGSARSLPNEFFPPAHTLVREARAVVSKPGGGTLIDSLAAATPVVLLEPYGEAEAKSGELWEELGFGIRFERWQQQGFDPKVLSQLHHNLLRASPVCALPSYPQDAWHRGSK